MTHSAHIQTALEAACKFGRAEYDARMKFKDYDVTNALRALAETSNNQQPTLNIEATRVVVGGGTSLEGRIKWLLENEGAMTSPEIAAKLSANVDTIRNIVSTLCKIGVIQRKSYGVFEGIAKMDVNRHPTTCRPSLSTMLKSVGLSFVLLAAGTRCEAQWREAATFSIEQPTLNVQGAFALAPAPLKQEFLTWDHQPGLTYRVQVGSARGNYTNSFIVSTNQFALTNGLSYAVWSVQNGIESAAPGLWPSNRVGELWLTGMGTNMTGGTNIVRLAKFTNSPPGNMQFWGVANITTGWE